MKEEKFPPEVVERLKWYVYRLIDPRNGETFYVGKGRGNRVFDHAKGALAPTKDEDEDRVDLKSKRIKDIANTGLEVGHVIHRHGIENEDVAFQIEAALIDAYSGLANRVSGHASGDFGVRHAREIINEYAAQPFVAKEPLILICIARTFEDELKNIYNAVRGCWKIDKNKTERFKLVLGHCRGLVRGAFRPKEWLPAKQAYFPWLDEDIPGRYGFVGEPAEQKVQDDYLLKRVSDLYRAKGAANPVRFVEPNGKP